MAVDVSYTVPVGGAVYAGRFAVASVASFAAQLNSITGNVTAAPAPAPSPGPAPSAQPFRVVRTGTRYATLAQAVAGSISGDTIKVAPGTYVIPAGPGEQTTPGNTWISGGINLTALTIEWEVPGIRTVIDLTGLATHQAGIGGQPIGIHAGYSNRSLTVRGLELIGFRGGDSYGIYQSGGYPSGNPATSLVVEYCKLTRWSDGVKTTYANQALDVDFDYSVVEDCSAGSLTHGLYVQGNRLRCRGSTFRTTVAGNPSPNFVGHLVKSRMKTTQIEACLFDMRGGGASCIEAPNGGALIVKGNRILKFNVGDNSNPPIKFGAEENTPWIDVSVSGAPFAVNDPIVGQATGASGTVVAITNGGTRLYFRPTSGGTRFEGANETILVSGVARGTRLGNYGGSPDGTSFDSRTHLVQIAQNTVLNEQRTGWPGTTATAIGMLWINASMTTDAAVPISPDSVLAAGYVRNNLIADIATGNRTVADIDPEPAYPDNSPVEASTITTSGAVTLLGSYSGVAIPCSPSVHDATLSYAGEFQVPTARAADLIRGAFAAQTDPAWRVGQLANTWRIVSNSRIQDVDPAFNPAMNPLGAGSNSPWRASEGIKAVIDAWGTAVWDEAMRRLWLPLEGGHSNYAGNECYMQPLGDASPTWTMPDGPSGSLQHPYSPLDDGLELTGAYGDGRPRSVHPYHTQCYVPGVGPVIGRMPAPFSDSNKSTSFVFCRDPATGLPRKVFDFADPSMTGNPGGSSTYGASAGGAIGAGVCYDSKRHRVVTIGIGNNLRVLWCTPSASPGMWSGGHLSTVISTVSGGSIIGMLYLPDPIDRYLCLTHWLGNLEHKLIDPVTGAMTDLGPLSAGLAAGFAREPGGICGASWAPELGKVLLWNQTSNTAQISTLTPHVSAPTTSPMTAGTLTVSGSNTVTPPAQAGNGTHGLFGYSSSLRGCYLIVPDNLGGSQTHFYATQV